MTALGVATVLVVALPLLLVVLAVVLFWVPEGSTLRTEVAHITNPKSFEVWKVRFLGPGTK